MKSIGLVTLNKAYLPELNAYKEFFASNYTLSIVCESEDLSRYDILWYFMGTSGKRYRVDQFVIHEYASLSTPPLSKIKNFIKRVFICKPDLRVFLNVNVKNEMGFSDEVPSVTRDMGVGRSFFECQEQTHDIKWDFIYVGSMEQARRIHLAIDSILKFRPDARVALVGLASDFLISRYSGNENIEFIGKVDYEEISSLIRSSHVGLNYVPDIYPYNMQTSTKFLEYLACERVVVTNRYSWVEEYCEKNDVDVIFLDELHKLTSLTIKASKSKVLSWDEVIEISRIESYLP
ncbi:glycosyltransferase family protein [Vibrio rhodolitus]|uniref:glycosyltransferase family protein n=1 Tax=Vibrio rhodolitus TaxID=2231649 RepID=UPI000E0A5BFA|nr:glycosyltransferase [Vibrio rhodolitus]